MMVTPDRGRDALAQLVTSMLDQPDVCDLMVEVVTSAAEVLESELVALVVFDRGGTQLLAATSHDPEELAVLGDPTHDRRVDSSEQGLVLDVFELVWCGHAFGALHVVRTSRDHLDDADARVAQSFADMAALGVAATFPVGLLDFSDRLQEVLRLRDTIEQAKGALAYLLDIEVHAAYDELVARAAGEGRSVAATARRVLIEAVPPGAPTAAHEG